MRLVRLARPTVSARRVPEYAVNDPLGQDSKFDVLVLRIARKKGERLVAVDTVALHDDAYRGSDVGTGVQPSLNCSTCSA